MRTIKIKFANGVTLAHPMAAPGKQPSGAIVIAVEGVPDNVSTATVLYLFQGSLAPWIGGEYVVKWEES
jgi:hypothetical protein